MKFSVDARSPVPLYHQIVEAVRYRIATGVLKTGTRLPSVRAAAGNWGVHLHTVRRAYAELAKQGLVEVRRPEGTTVCAAPSSNMHRSFSLPLHGDVNSFLKRIRKKHGITAKQVSDLILSLESSGESVQQFVTVVECNMPQAAYYADQLQAIWQVSATPSVIDDSGEPPPGPILATYFHFNDVRARWADRVEDIHFISVHLEPSLVDRCRTFARPTGRTTIILGETDAGRALNIRPDVKRLLDTSHFRLLERIVDEPASLLRSRCRTPVLLAPRLWARLSDQERRSPFAIELRYVLNAESIEALADHLGWRRHINSNSCASTT